MNGAIINEEAKHLHPPKAENRSSVSKNDFG